jgi:hypothetical protein
MKKLLIVLMLLTAPCYSAKMCPIEKENEEMVKYRILLIKMGIKKVYDAIEEAEIPPEQKLKIIKNMENLEVYLGFAEFK